MRRRVMALVALAALAGCGDELEKFRDDLRPLEQRAEGQRAVISGLLRSLQLGNRADAQGVREQAKDLSATYDQIAAIEPPDDYAEPFADYLGANRASVRDLHGFAAELEHGDLRGVRLASRRVLADLSRAHSASLQWLE